MQLQKISDVAATLGLSDVTLENWSYRRRPAPAGFPSPIRVGRQLRYLQSEIEGWIRAQCGDQPASPPQAAVAPARRRPGRPRRVEPVGGAK